MLLCLYICHRISPILPWLQWTCIFPASTFVYSVPLYKERRENDVMSLNPIFSLSFSTALELSKKPSKFSSLYFRNFPMFSLRDDDDSDVDVRPIMIVLQLVGRWKAASSRLLSINTKEESKTNCEWNKTKKDDNKTMRNENVLTHIKCEWEKMVFPSKRRVGYIKKQGEWKRELIWARVQINVHKYCVGVMWCKWKCGRRRLIYKFWADNVFAFHATETKSICFFFVMINITVHHDSWWFLNSWQVNGFDDRW